ncbi:type IVB secretion system protein IcmH/DotU [Legionella dresdenensis]|uniref:Type IVB secretion system protein IcmH/DotU n=1 Tax=Legionella dresdenensis TaxID=450200 RepID=A0ABV8CDY6_9GAMM
MTAGQLSISLVNRLSLSDTNKVSAGYYRSKLFIAPFTTNPLVAAAGPLLSLMERLCISPSVPPINSIRDNIEHEMRAFHSRLEGKDYTDELDCIAHYLLCATIDELLGKCYLRLHGKAPEFVAFTPSSYDETGPEERFFDVIAYIKERPNQYLDVIELAYYCLISGFEGKYHQQADGRLALDNLIEELFQLIQQHRVNKPLHLFKDTEKAEIEMQPVKSYRTIIAAGCISVAVLVASYALSYVLLDNQAKNIQFGHTVIAKLDD